MKKLFIIILTSAFVLTSTGCYGSFGLTKKVYKFHGTLGDKWIKSLLMFFVGGLVYGTTSFVDAVFLNAIEFWTGHNPIATGDTMEQIDQNGNKLVATKLPGGALDLTMIGIDGSVKKVTLINNGETISAYDESGKVVAQFETTPETATN